MKLSPQSQRVLERAAHYGAQGLADLASELLLLVQAQGEALGELTEAANNYCAYQGDDESADANWLGGAIVDGDKALAHADEVMKRLGGAG